MNLVVHKNVPFANVDDETVRAAIKFDGISSKILKAHMIALPFGRRGPSGCVRQHGDKQSDFRRVEAPMIGCAAHRLNLAVKDYVKNHTARLSRSQSNAKAKECQGHNHVKTKPLQIEAVPLRELRWSMRQSRWQAHPEEAPANDPRQFPIVQFLPDPGEHCSILDILDDMKLLEMATKAFKIVG
ncbi:hypothetical protein GQ600_15642 [Phytophthora cactorum]|nr:hypothetical protein GQ600_15642 [Phytophthora cactorum]